MLISVFWFSYLIASMGLQGLWSFGLACLDIYALRRKRDLQNPILVSLFVVGDWVLLSSLRLFSLTFSHLLMIHIHSEFCYNMNQMYAHVSANCGYILGMLGSSILKRHVQVIHYFARNFLDRLLFCSREPEIPLSGITQLQRFKKGITW